MREYIKACGNFIYECSLTISGVPAIYFRNWSQQATTNLALRKHTVWSEEIKYLQ